MALFENFPYTNLHELNLDWIVKEIKKLAENYPDISEELNKKINKPIVNPDGTLNYVLVSNGNGTTRWEDPVVMYVPEIYDAVNEWLNDHPEATTTVQDGSITEVKFNSALVDALRGIPFAFNPKLTGTVEVWKDNPLNYSAAQGFCVVDGAIFLGYSSPNNASNGIIQRLKNGVYTNLTGTFYHMNSMCTDGEFIYSLDCLEGVDDNVTTLNTVTVIDINTFAYATRLTLNYTGSGSLAGLMYNNGLYCMDSDGKVYSVDGEGNLTLYAELANFTGTTQQTYMNDNYIFIASAYPNMIFIYKHDGSLWNVIPVGNMIENVSTVTELEGVYIDGDYLYTRIITTTNEDLIVKTNLNRTPKTVTSMYTGDFVQTVYVDGNENTQARIDSLYFKTIQNAINYASTFKDGKFIIKLLVSTSEKIEMNSESTSIRIDGGTGIVFSGSIVVRAGNLTLQNLAITLTGTDEFMYISNASNTLINVYIISAALTGVATTNFIRTYGKCYILCNVTGELTNKITLNDYAVLETESNLIIVQSKRSRVIGNGILNNISGYMTGRVPVAKSVDITLSENDIEITQTGITAEQNTNIEIRTNDGSKNNFYISTTNVQIMPFYVVNDNTVEVYYIRLRRDSSDKLYARLINPPTSTVKINLIVFH